MRATLVGRAGVSRPVNEKRRKTSNVVPAIPLRRYITSSTLLSRKVFSLASCRICGGDRLGRWRGSNSFFFFSLFLARSSLPTYPDSDCQFQYSGSIYFAFV